MSDPEIDVASNTGRGLQRDEIRAGSSLAIKVAWCEATSLQEASYDQLRFQDEDNFGRYVRIIEDLDEGLHVIGEWYNEIHSVLPAAVLKKLSDMPRI